jgi:hypothetical protein
MSKRIEEFEFKKKWFNYMGYKPHEGQRKLHFPEKPDANYFVNICGRRYGKTTAAYREAEFYAAQPDRKIWLVGLSYKKSRLMFREVWRDMVIGKSNDIDRASEKEQYIKFKWGTTVEGMSCENPDSLVGEGVDLLIIDEAAKMPKKIWDMYLSPTLVDRKGKAIFITTPEGYNWVYDLYLLGKSDKNWCSMQSPSWENQYAFPDGQEDSFLQERKRNMSKELFDQEFAAKFTSMEGRVYPFDRELDMAHLPYNVNLPTYCSMDFGYRMPSILWFQTYQSDGHWYINIIDEVIHKQNIPTEKLVKMIKEKSYPVVAYYGDPAGSFVQGQSGMGDIHILRRHGIYVQYRMDRLSRDVQSGVSYCRGFFENAEGLRRIKVDKKCVGIAEDFEGYRFPEAKEGKGISNNPIKDGRYEHGCDAFRYFILNRFPIRSNFVGRLPR